jgi:hypothetical protein
MQELGPLETLDSPLTSLASSPEITTLSLPDFSLTETSLPASIDSKTHHSDTFAVKPDVPIAASVNLGLDAKIPPHPTPLLPASISDVDFAQLWSRGAPLVVHGITVAPDLWTPESFIRAYATRRCEIVECQSENVKQTTVGAFFETFGRYNGRTPGCWKLKVNALATPASLPTNNRCP